MGIIADKKIDDFEFFDFLMSTPCCIVEDMGKLVKIFGPVENCIFRGSYKDCLKYLNEHEIKRRI